MPFSSRSNLYFCSTRIKFKVQLYSHVETLLYTYICMQNSVFEKTFRRVIEKKLLAKMFLNFFYMHVLFCSKQFIFLFQKNQICFRKIANMVDVKASQNIRNVQHFNENYNRYVAFNVTYFNVWKHFTNICVITPEKQCK